jgi:hypothetical protein
VGPKGQIVIAPAGWVLLLLYTAGQGIEVRPVEREAPKSIPSWLAKNLSSSAIEIRFGTETPAHFYPTRTLVSIATKEQLQNGLGPDDFELGEWIGLLEVHRPVSDYRHMNVPPGLYSLRFAHQPDSDDHKDTAPGRLFALLCPVQIDLPSRPKELANLLERAKIETRKHPSPWFAFISKTKPSPNLPALKEEPPKHQSILWRQKVETQDGNGETVMGLTWQGPG